MRYMWVWAMAILAISCQADQNYETLSLILGGQNHIPPHTLWDDFDSQRTNYLREMTMYTSYHWMDSRTKTSLMAIREEIEELSPHWLSGFEGEMALYPLEPGLPMNYTKAVEAFTEGVRRGDTRSLYYLSLFQGLGLHHEKDKQKAAVLSHFAATKGLPLALYTVAYQLTYGYGRTKECPSAKAHYLSALYPVVLRTMESGLPNLKPPSIDLSLPHGYSKQSVEYRSFGASSGDPESMVIMAIIHLTGYGDIPIDYDIALEYLDEGLLMQYKGAYGYMGLCYEKGYGVDMHIETALDFYRKGIIAEDGLSEARMGEAYLRGVYVEQNIAEAIRLFQSAVEHGSGEGMLRLGVMYYYGIGVERNIKLASKYMHMAAQEGNIVASYNLAILQDRSLCSLSVQRLRGLAMRQASRALFQAVYQYRMGNRDQALFILLQYSLMGSVNAMEQALYALEQGASFHDQDTQLKDLLLVYAAELNSPSAMLALGDVYYYDRKQPHRAAEYYQKASEKGSAEAAYNLGYMYAKGDGVELDYPLSKRAFDRTLSINPSTWMIILLTQGRIWVGEVWEGEWNYSPLRIDTLLVLLLQGSLLVLCYVRFKGIVNQSNINNTQRLEP